MTTEGETTTSHAEDTEQVAAVPEEQQEACQNATDAATDAEDMEEPHNTEPEGKEEIEEGATDAAPGDAAVPSPAPTAASTVAESNKAAGEADPRSDIERQPYDFDRCTVQIAIQLLPNDGDAKGRPVLIGVRTHLDAPMVRMMRANDLGDLPPAITALVGQLKSELPAREQAARERWEKEKEARAPRHTKASPAKAVRTARGSRPAKATTVGAGAAPAPSVLTDEQRANAVDQAATANKQQMALF